MGGCAAALDFEAFRGNVGALHPAIAGVRRSPGVLTTLTRVNALLEGSGLFADSAPRFLQDPLSYRCVPQVHGAARDALAFVENQVAVELNSHQGNPLVVPDEKRLVSVGNFDSQALATALDLARLALAPVLTAAVERTLKLLSPRFSGLTEGLVAAEGSWQDGLSELGVAAQAIAAEARLLAQPVSIELASTMQESGVEDRTSLSSLGGRRLDEMVGLAARLVAIELVVAAQAIDLRGGSRARRRRGRDARVRARACRVPRRARAHAPPARRAGEHDPRRRAAGVTTYDLHQHLWPESFVEALRERKTPPRLDGDVLETLRGPFRGRPRAPRPRDSLAALDRDGIDVAVLSLQPSLGLRDLAAPECEELELAWVDAVRELDSTRFRAFSPSCVRDGFVGVSLGSSAFLDFDAVAPTLDAAADGGRHRLRASGGRSRLRRRAARVVGVGRRLPGADAGGVLSRGSPSAGSGGRRCACSSRCSAAAGRSSSSGSRAAASTFAPHSTRTRSSTSRRTGGGRSSSASRRSASASSSTAATRRSSTRARHWMPSAVSEML